MVSARRLSTPHRLARVARDVLLLHDQLKRLAPRMIIISLHYKLLFATKVLSPSPKLVLVAEREI